MYDHSVWLRYDMTGKSSVLNTETNLEGQVFQVFHPDLAILEVLVDLVVLGYLEVLLDL